MGEKFTATEQKSLAPFFTNLDKPVFGLKLPQEVAGALFSRYSRSTKSLRRTFLDEFLGDPEVALNDLLGGSIPSSDQSAALKKARAFYDRVLVGYGDDSVAQLGGAHIACENISNVAANILEDARIGIAPLEKSTRYVRFDQKDESGNYLFYREPKIMASPHCSAYLETMNLLFETYSRQIDPMIEFVKRSLPIEDLELRHPQSGEPVNFRDAQRDEKLKRWAESAYRSTVRAQACDILRGYLPAATLTNVGFFGVGQAFEYLITKLYSHELSEAKELAGAIHQELNQLIPSFVKRAKLSEYMVETFAATRTLATTLAVDAPANAGQSVSLVDYDREAEEKIIAAILYPHSRHPLEQLRRSVSRMPVDQRRKVLDEYLGRRRHRRDKPGRALEQVYYTFDILGNLGLYRDLHRHRILTQERQDFTTVHGYDTPEEIVEAGFKSEFDRCMERVAGLYEKIHHDLPLEAQYVVPFAFKIRWSMKMNLREAVFIGELRSLPQGHPDYRFITQEMWRRIQEVHPTLAECAKFIDWKSYRLGRLQSEMRTEYKKSVYE
ncbi:MAG TPA: FAD-dependent thymidylate synthase [Candidatus Binatia bacterium]|jgi:thymidylate synthase ThyX|nr:FAD-dependent thymidylate synthase [Candidatus Binatia bacterium]